jgi:peptide/nickel transport system substrate-binding protein
MDILKKYLDQATGEAFIPYAATLSQYISADEAKARYANLAKFYAEHNHFWIGTGPYVLDKVFLTEKSLTLKNNPEFPDLADRWSNFGEPKLAEAQLDGAGQVKIGDEATFDIFVTFKGEPYPQAEIKQVKYLLYNAKGEVALVGLADVVADGQYKVVLPKDVTAKLEAGSNKLEIAVIPLPVSVPTFTSMEFVTTP